MNLNPTKPTERAEKKTRSPGDGPARESARRILDFASTFTRLEIFPRSLGPQTIAACFLVLLTGCQTPARPPLPEQAAPPPRVILSSGDVVRLTFSGAPELNQSQKIRADGKISLPQIGEATANGKTIAQFQSELVALYRPLIMNTDVLVTLDSGQTRVYFSGAVGRPGKIIFDRPTTILQALTEAGGINQFGNPRRVQLIRLANGVEQTQVIDLRPTLAGKTTRPFYVRDGDIISVPIKAF